MKNQVTELLNIEVPIIQAPMAGGITTSSFVAEVSNCGGLGTIGAGYMTSLQLREQIKEIKQITNKNYGINLFVPNDFYANENQILKSNMLLQPFNEELNINQNNSLQVPNINSLNETYYEQIKVIIEEKVPICSFTFGIPSMEIIKELKLHNILLIGTATTVNEAIEIEEAGMDLVVVQGSEAGGHRGNFIKENEESLIGLMSLVPQVVNHVNIPVIAAGGIMDGRGLIASLSLGAMAVQMGTAFLTCIESGAHEVHKKAILNATEEELVLTRAFSGKWARGIENKFTKEMRQYENTLPQFPVQNTITQSIRKASSIQNNKEFMSLWSGQSPRLSKNGSVKNLMYQIINEAKQIQRNFINL